MFGNLGTPELLLIFLIVLVLFGSKKIPEFAKGLGKGIREFKEALRGVEDEMQKEANKPGDSSHVEEADSKMIKQPPS